ncbi:MAG: hypothetical protein J6M42_03745 [Clostridia bacterium]|nr:hypothetical protein [Clostridia bacterium]
MSKTAKGLLIAALCVLTTWVGLSTLYAHSLSEELTLLRREGRSDTVYLRSRIRELESELTVYLREVFTAPYAPMGGEASTEGLTDGETVTDKETVGETAPQKPADTEGVTLPTHNSPETVPSVDSLPTPETAPAAPYLVAAHNGIIGLFDASGALLRTVNVYLMTLPEADRAALTVGIPAGDWEEALELLGRYE